MSDLFKKEISRLSFLKSGWVFFDRFAFLGKSHTTGVRISEFVWFILGISIALEKVKLSKNKDDPAYLHVT